MTLEEFYHQREALSEELNSILQKVEPNSFTKDYNIFTIEKPYKEKIKSLKEQLSPEDLDVVNNRDRNWKRKVQSSVS